MTTTAPTRSRWLRTLRRVGRPRVRLVCFPHAGGAASFFRNWPGRLPADVEVLAVRYPGREDRILDPLVDDMAELVRKVAAELVPLGDRPLALFGHSMGASVAHETARTLAERHAVPPALLLVSGRSAPHLLRRTGLGDLDDAGLLADVRQRGGPLAAALDDPDLVELVRPAIRADYRLLDRYALAVPTATVEVPLVAYGGEEDPGVPAADVHAWSAATAGPFDSRILPGDHFYLVPNESDLVADIADRLALLGPITEVSPCR